VRVALDAALDEAGRAGNHRVRVYAQYVLAELDIATGAAAVAADACLALLSEPSVVDDPKLCADVSRTCAVALAALSASLRTCCVRTC
jgi:hypothetical protein